MKQSVTMKDIADKLAISTVTVSKALSDKEGVGEDLRSVIKKTAEEMGYRYNVSAKALKEGRNYNIGVLIPSHYVDTSINADTFYLKMYKEVTSHLTQYGYSSILELVTEEMEERHILPQCVTGIKADGIIVLGQLSNAYLSELAQAEVQTVYLDFYDKQMDVDAIIMDNVYGSYMLTNYVVSMGHTKIAFVGSIYATASILDRYLGYYRSLLVNHLQVPADYRIEDRDAHGIYIDFQLPEDMPTAFVCNCDEAAYYLIDKLRSKGYRVPEDVSVVGFDNSSFAEYSSPKLTTVAVNVEAMTQAAVDTLLRKLGNEEKAPERKVIGGKLMIRESVSRVK